MKGLQIAYQLYSARKETLADLKKVLKSLNKLGYDGVEFAGFCGYSAQEIKKMLADAGLEAASSHVPVKDLKEDLGNIIAYHKKIGCRYIAIPYLEESQRPGKPGFADTIRFISETGRKCRKEDLRLLYHNHDFEFEKVSGMYGLDFLFAAVPEKWLQTEIDTCWADYSGVDPAAYLLKYAGRAPFVHLKDYVGSRGASTPYGLIGSEESHPDKEIVAFEYRPFGHGSQNVDALLDAAARSGTEWLIIEQDEHTGISPMEAAALSIQTIRKYEKKHEK